MAPEQVMRMGKRRFFNLYARLCERAEERANDERSEGFFARARAEREGKW